MLMAMEVRFYSLVTVRDVCPAYTSNLPFGGTNVASYFCDDARPSQVGGGVSRAVIIPRFGNTV
jgi:hypothetical protein